MVGVGIFIACIGLFWGGMTYQKLQYADVAREAAEQANAETADLAQRHIEIERDINERLEAPQGESGNCTWNPSEREWLFNSTRPLPAR